MKFQFYVEESTGKPHIYEHDVFEYEIYEFFNEIRYFEDKRDDGSFIAYGRLTGSHRFLKIVYRKIQSSTYYIITAYDIEDLETVQYLEEFYNESS